jgi:DegV family protein with EDD domain
LNKVLVVTDSTADMNAVDVERLKIFTVPLSILWNGETFRDGVDMSLEEFYQKLRTDKGLPRTSQPSAGQFVEVYQRLLEEADAIVSIHISAGISGTLNAAQAAAEQVAPEKIAVVDSRTLAYAEGALVNKTAEVAQSGASLKECVRFAESLVPRLRLYSAADTLEYLMRGGRVSRLQAFAGTLLAIKPMLHVVDGKLVPAERVRTRAAAVRKMAELLLAEGDLEEAAVMYADVPEPAEELYKILHEARPDLPIKWGRTGAVIGAHNGPGLYGSYGLVAE